MPTVEAIPAEPVLPPMPQTKCPKLRFVRELLREEHVARILGGRLEGQQDAVEKWRGAPAKGGNEAFFRLGVDLRATGMTASAIEAMLWQEAGYGRHPVERRSQIRSIMRTLGNGHIRAAA